MTEASLSLEESGKNLTTLRAIVGNDLQVTWKLTNDQLAYLAAQAVRIVKHRAEMGLIEASGLKAALKALDGEDAA